MYLHRLLGEGEGEGEGGRKREGGRAGEREREKSLCIYTEKYIILCIHVRVC